MKIRWLKLANGCPEFGAYDKAYDLADQLTGWEGTPPEIAGIEHRLHELKLGVVTEINGHRIVKVEMEIL